MTFANTEPPRIKSFVQRKGRVTPGQKFALENHAQQYCLDPKIDVDFTNTFGNDAPLIIEIGFGNGDSLAKIAAKNPDKNYLGIEVHRPGVGHLLVLIEEMQLTNIRIYCHDAIEILEQRVPNASVMGLHLFFLTRGIRKNILNVVLFGIALWNYWHKNLHLMAIFTPQRIGKIMQNGCSRF